MRKNMMRRQSLIYKIKFWFYRLTFQDVLIKVKKVSNLVIEFIMCALMFGLLFFGPAFFH